jgi:uncharacterized membrane protein
MKTKGLLLFSAVLIGALAITAIAAGLALPPGLKLPMHWNAAGEIDRYGGKWPALLLPIGLAIFGTIIAGVITRVEPNRDSIARSTGLIRVVWFGLLGLAWVIELMELAVAFHWPIHPARILIGGLGIFFAALGNQLGKSRPMHLVGIRTPWTLADPDVWIATHRLGGKLLFVAGGIWFVVALADLRLPGGAAMLTAIMLGAALFPVFWSYVLWRRSTPRAR